MRARRKLVVATDHSGGCIVGKAKECEVDGGASIVFGALGGIGNEALAGRRHRFPEELGHRPRSVSVVN
jgi:hypothetical protein